MTVSATAIELSPTETLGSRMRRLVGRLRELPLLFAVLAFVIGSFLVFAQPPGQGLDEAVHFNRVWTLAQGTLVVPIHHGEPGGYIPKCVVDYVGQFGSEATKNVPFSFSQYWQSPPHCSMTPAFSSVGTAATNSPVSYAPSIIAVAVLRGVGASIPVIFFGGRFVTLLGFVALFYLAIRLTPVGRQVFFVLGLLPTTLLVASSYSADPMTISLAALSVALTLRCRLTVDATWRTALALVVVLVGLGLTKPTLFVFAPLVLLVPSNLISRFRRPGLARLVALLIVLGCTGVWYLIVRHAVGAPFPLYGLNSHVQSKFIEHHPIGYLKVLARTFFEGTGENRWIPGFFLSIGYFRKDSVYAPVGLVVVGSVTLFYAYQLQTGAKRLVDHGTRLLALMPVALVLVGILIVETTLYTYGTPVGLPYTQAEGRYFIPFALLLLVTIGVLRQPRVRPRSTRWILLGVALMLVWLVLKIFVHDYTL
jgi:uncharacterized membrane protein